MKGDKEDGHGTDAKMTREQLLTDPDQAAELPAKRSSTRSLSPLAPPTAHISSHVAPPARSFPSTAWKEIHARLPNTHLVMHGSSSVRRNTSLKSASSAATCAKPTAYRLKKFRKRSNTAYAKSTSTRISRLAMTAAIRRYLVENPSGFDPRAYLKAARKAAEKPLPRTLSGFRLRGAGRQD